MIKKILPILACTLLQSAVAQVVIYSEDFQSGMPAGYSVVDNDGNTPHASVSEFTAAWIEMVDPGDTTAMDTIVASTSYFDPAGTADRWLITDTITLGAYGNIAYWETRSFDPSYADGYFVLVSTTDSLITSFTDTLYVINSEGEFWTEHSANLSELGLDNQTIRLAFVNRTYDGHKLFLDDIRIEALDPVGLNELDNVSLNIYPNPSSDYINVVGIQGVMIVEIYSINGQLLLQSEKSNIDISQLESGNYLIVAKGKNQIAHSRFVKH